MSYSQRGVLVVGGLGFIGAYVTARLVDAGARVTVVTPNRERHEEQAAKFEAAGVHVIEGDLRDHAVISHAVAGHDVIFNLSGQSGAVRSMEDPWTDLEINCRGNLVLLECIREHAPAAKLVFVGSRLEYGRPEVIPVAEEGLGEPLCLHAIHKRTVEEYLRLYGRLFNLRYTIARVTNPYGPGQPRGRTAYGVINRLVHLALADEPLTIYGDGTQQRDYVHADDVASALLTLGSAVAADGRVFNVGSGTGARLVDVARLIVEITGRGRVEHVAWPPLAEKIETGDFVADISRIRREVGWAPVIGLRDGLTRTVAFYRDESRAAAVL